LPTVTILIPAFNAGRLVESTIRSALAQTYSDLEILVVDDGSTDDTAARARAFGDRVRVLGVPHGGLASARNHGMRAAAGRFIVFLDADDLLEAPLVARAVDFLERRPDLAFVFCNVCLFQDEAAPSAPCIPSSVLAGQPEAVVQDPLVDILGSGYPISSSGLCARREALFEAGFFDETLWGSEDFEYWSRLYLRRPVGYLASPLARIRRHEGNMTRQASRMIHSMAASRAKVIANCLSAGRPDLVPTVRRFARYHMSGAARDVLMGGDPAEARRLLARYWRELLGFRWILLMAASLCPTPILRAMTRLRFRRS
jgi:glycosyltransferase involved in cell wall biosynthesis